MVDTRYWQTRRKKCIAEMVPESEQLAQGDLYLENFWIEPEG